MSSIHNAVGCIAWWDLFNVWFNAGLESFSTHVKQKKDVKEVRQKWKHNQVLEKESDTEKRGSERETERQNNRDKESEIVKKETWINRTDQHTKACSMCFAYVRKHDGEW